jgi:hypothetical protein
MIGLIRGIAQGRHLSIAACHLVGRVFCCEHLKRLEEIFRFVCADFEVDVGGIQRRVAGQAVAKLGWVIKCGERAIRQCVAGG